MKNKIYKILRIELIIPLTLFLSTLLIFCKLIYMVVNDSEEAFYYDKFSIYIVILIILFCAISLLLLVIYNYKKSDIFIKRYTKEEKEKLIKLNRNQNIQRKRIAAFLPPSIIFILMGGLLVYLNIQIFSEDESIAFFLFLGVMFIFAGIIMFVKIFEKDD